MKVAQPGTLAAHIEGSARDVDTGRAVALLITRTGSLTLHQDARGRLWADVVGFDTPDELPVLSAIGGELEDIVSEVCVMVDPPEGVTPDMLGLPRLHRRRAP